MKTPKWWLRLWSRFGPSRKLHVVNGDSPPDNIKDRDLYLAREDGEDWAVAMRCPCGCGDRLELMLLAEVKPHWTVANDRSDLPTLRPSVWRQERCRSHFHVIQGRIIWSN